MKRYPVVSLSFGLAVGLLVVLWASATITAQGARPAPASAAVARGQAIFSDHCAVCHGNRGKGNGPAAGALTPRPPDLSHLSGRTGAFPTAHVTAVIKGTDPVVAHGSQAMMIWGAFFLADANGNAAVADERIGELVKFIESIQERK